MKSVIVFILKLFFGYNNKTFTRSKNGKRILLVRLNRIGDALVCTPIIKALLDNNFQVDIIADKKNYFIFKNFSGISEIFVFTHRFNSLLDIIKATNQKRFDYIVDLHDDLSTTVSLIIAFSNAQQKFGLSKKTASLYSKTIDRPDARSNHVIERISQLLKLFNLNPAIAQKRVFLPIDNRSSNIINNLLNDHFPGHLPLLGINISAGSPARFWGVEKYIELLESIPSHSLNIIILSSPGDKELAKRISSGKYPTFSTEDFTEFAAIISRLNLLFTPDTSVVHLASAYNIPMFGIYVKFNTDEIIWYPYDTDYEAIITEEPNFINLEVQLVINKLKIFLGNYVKY
ncbi:MAG: glycosyltransferase family 9 protein [Ignavibacteriales bacterium]|nr:glycosyltransferase family 9 protein [Ignavibacteriales bacterium]